MSYTVCVYESSARGNDDFDPEAPPSIPHDVLERFERRLTAYGYRPSRKGTGHGEYEKSTESWAVQVHVRPTEIAFRAPNGTDAQDAVFEALMTASELCDRGDLAAFDPQTEEWLD